METKFSTRLPVPTFRFLGVNGTERPLPAEQPEPEVLSGTGIQRLDVAADAAFTVAGGQTVIMDIHAEHAYLQTHLQANAYEKVRLVQIFHGDSVCSRLTADLADSASAELIQIYLHGTDTVSDTEIRMNGRKSAFTANIGYLADGDAQLDLNLNVIQSGKKSVSDIDVQGVLRGRAKKIFRGTIDFQQGAAGASGAEHEDVLLTDPEVVNKTVPVILCAEEDVVGTHGATAGQLDARGVFYLQSRGIPEAEIRELIAQTKLGSVIRKIGDAATERDVWRLLGREDADEPFTEE
ncbi:MAG: SufD family Fe-S cluster assembly protein [Oscillospiraceae bacterium]|nr:SufD family Fe-S cluster assembly protein [Oscillospiraceae bacterium]